MDIIKVSLRGDHLPIRPLEPLAGDWSVSNEFTTQKALRLGLGAFCRLMVGRTGASVQPLDCLVSRFSVHPGPGRASRARR